MMCSNDNGTKLQASGVPIERPRAPEQAARAVVEATFDRIEETTRQVVAMEAREAALRQELRDAKQEASRLCQRLDELARELAQIGGYIDRKDLLPHGQSRSARMGALRMVQAAFEGHDQAAIKAIQEANARRDLQQARRRRR